jgi:NAD(P)H-flavin reductase
MNPYLPAKAEIIEIIQETFSLELDVKTFRLRFVNGAHMEFLPGQFVELSIPGVGECPFGFASSPLEKDYFELTIKRTGKVTGMIHSLQKGDNVWIRGPFGNAFPLELMEGNDLFFVAGGLGLAPLRPFILYALSEQNREKYGRIQMLLAARTGKDHIYAYEYAGWKAVREISIDLTIDNPEPGWSEMVGFPHNLVKDMRFDFSNLYAMLCGPPVMIKAVHGSLNGMGMPSNRLYTTLEMRMTCGVGKCGKCNIGRQYVCVDGPVFSMEALSALPSEY